MKFQLQEQITKKYLLDRNSQETYLEYYLGIPVKKGLFKSPLRKDNKPTCAFYKNKYGNIIFKDFSGQFSGDFVTVVMEKYGVSYYTALRMIANDFGYISSPNIKRNPKPIKISTTEFKDSGSANIQVELKEFSRSELNWWQRFGINRDVLKKYRIYSCKTVFLNGNIFSMSDERHPIFGYYRGKNSEGLELWRIYFPKHRSNEPRFLSNWSATMIQGAKQLPKEGDFIIVTKSMKDVACLFSCFIPAIAPNSENLFLTDSQYEKLKQRFKRIYLLYDLDTCGIANSKKIKQQHPDITVLLLPRTKRCKDISDYYKTYGRTETLKLIEQAKEYYEKGT